DPEIAVSERPHGLCDEDRHDFSIGTKPAHVVASLKRGTTCWGLTVTQRLLSINAQGPTGPEVSYEFGGSCSLRGAHPSDGSTGHVGAGWKPEHRGPSAASRAARRGRRAARRRARVAAGRLWPLAPRTGGRGEPLGAGRVAQLSRARRGGRAGPGPRCLSSWRARG